MNPSLAFTLSTALVIATTSAFSKPALPDASLNLKLAGPIETWDEAVPLGNGSLGVLLWGETNLLRLSLDRGDLWDERPSPAFLKVRDQFNWAALQQLVASNRMASSTPLPMPTTITTRRPRNCPRAASRSHSTHPRLSRLSS
jgi:hypothetical protein